jgi:hypothetical protein
MVGNPAGYTLDLDPAAVRVLDRGIESAVSEVGSDVLSGDFFGVIEDDPETAELLDTLEPYRGMWVRNATPDRRDITLRLPSGTVGPRPGRPLSYTGDGDAWIGTLEARIVGDDGATIRSAVVERVVQPGDGIGRDIAARVVSKPPVSPSNELDLALVSPDEDRRVAVWVDDAAAPRELQLVVTASREVELSGWERSAGAGTGAHHMALRSLSTGRTWDLATVRSIVLPAGVHRFSVDVLRGGAAPVPHVVRVQVTPNPTRGAAWIDLDTPSAGSAALALFDVHGRRVWTDDMQVRDAGRHAIPWDGPEKTGIANGVYWLTLDFRGEGADSTPIRRREKIVVLR